MAINFEYRSGILEAADPDTDNEWCWFKGDTEATRSSAGVVVGSIQIPAEATVVQVKAAIRQDAKRR